MEYDEVTYRFLYDIMSKKQIHDMLRDGHFEMLMTTGIMEHYLMNMYGSGEINIRCSSTMGLLIV